MRTVGEILVERFPAIRTYQACGLITHVNHPEEFIDRSNPLMNLFDSILAHVAHPTLRGSLEDRILCPFTGNEVPDLGVNDQNLEDRDSPFIAGIAAGGTPFSSIELHSGGILSPAFDFEKLFRTRAVRFFAVITDFSDQPLSNDAVKG